MRTYDDTDRLLTAKERVRFAGALSALLLVSLASAPAGCELRPQPLADASAGHRGYVPPSDSAAYVMKRSMKIMEQMSKDYGVPLIHVDWSPCDMENGFYMAGDPATIGICAEDLAHPGWTIQVAAHEFGHYVTDTLADITDENAADELSILAMADHGWWDEMLDAATYMRTYWPAEHMPGDPHPGGAYRAWEMACAEAGVEGLSDPTRAAPLECVALYQGLVVKWDHRLPRRR